MTHPAKARTVRTYVQGQQDGKRAFTRMVRRRSRTGKDVHARAAKATRKLEQRTGRDDEYGDTKRGRGMTGGRGIPG